MNSYQIQVALLHLQLDPSSGIPIYRQMMDQIQRYIVLGAIGPGDQLPSIRALAEQLRVNPTTVVKAYTELEHTGIIERQHGRGVFVHRQVNDVLERRRNGLNAVGGLDQEATQLVFRALELGLDPTAVRAVVEDAIKHIMGGDG